MEAAAFDILHFLRENRDHNVGKADPNNTFIDRLTAHALCSAIDPRSLDPSSKGLRLKTFSQREPENRRHL